MTDINFKDGAGSVGEARRKSSRHRQQYVKSLRQKKECNRTFRDLEAAL